MTDQPVRCPYCVSGDEFRPMIANAYRTFICDRCGHSERPDLDDYICRCQKCTEVNRAA